MSGWREKAVCPQTDPEAFFPEKSGAAMAAKRVCRQCPVRVQCLDWALANNETWGVWGGLSATERRALRAGLKLVAA